MNFEMRNTGMDAAWEIYSIWEDTVMVKIINRITRKSTDVYFSYNNFLEMRTTQQNIIGDVRRAFIKLNLINYSTIREQVHSDIMDYLAHRMALTAI